MYAGSANAQCARSGASCSSSTPSSFTSATKYSASSNSVRTSEHTASYVCGSMRSLHHCSSSCSPVFCGASLRRAPGSTSNTFWRTFDSESLWRRSSGNETDASCAAPPTAAAAAPPSTSRRATMWFARTMSSSMSRCDAEAVDSSSSPSTRPSESVLNAGDLRSSTTEPLSMRSLRRAAVTASRQRRSPRTSCEMPSSGGPPSRAASTWW
mmetsp:Transcript_32267/g.85741  ORF Transcript_32267/g.85741 Transcript_32267/m.85741 type:complete len:211 (-) Transcript_32267:76-708(-)